METVPAEPLTLYRLQACPFCERVVRTLQELDIPYESRFVEARHSRRNVVKRLVGKRTVPAIYDPNTGVKMAESANIVEFLETTYGDEGGRVADPAAGSEAATEGTEDGEAVEVAEATQTPGGE